MNTLRLYPVYNVDSPQRAPKPPFFAVNEDFGFVVNALAIDAWSEYIFIGEDTRGEQLVLGMDGYAANLEDYNSGKLISE